jgi:UMF1 family MFS transporter
MTIKAFESHDEEEREIEAKDTRKGNVLLWYSYDMADNFFSQTVISLAFTPFAMLLGVQQGWTLVNTFIVISLFMAGSNLLVALFGLLLGAISDTAGKRKPAVIFCMTIMITTAALITVWVNFWWAAILFVIGNFFYQAGRMFYDAQIPFIAETEKRSLYQAIGGALAPFGSLLGIVAGLVSGAVFGQATTVKTEIWTLAQQQIEEINYTSLRYLFAIASVVILILCIPYFFHKEVENPTDISTKENIKESFISVRRSLKTIISDRNSWLFYLGWFFMIDAANTTILYMVPVIEGACQAPSQMMTYLVIGLGIVLSSVFGVFMGYLLKRFGPKATFIFSGFAWMAGLLFFMIAGWQYKTEVIGELTIIHQFPWWIAFFGAVCIGIGFGGVWIIGRQFVMILAPPSKLAQYAGFQKIAGRVSAIVSPLIFAGMMFAGEPLGANHAYRIALASVFSFFVIGIIFLSFIKDPYKRYLEGERAPYPGIYDDEKEENE